MTGSAAEGRGDHRDAAVGAWSSLQLAEFLAVVTAFTDERAAYDRAVEQVAIALEAEVVAVLLDDEPHAVIGFAPGDLPAAALTALAERRPDGADLPHLGACALLVADVDERTALVVCRAGDPFDTTDRTLLSGMASVLALALRPLRQLEVERGLRRLSERQAAENARLLEAAGVQQRFTEGLYRIQRDISARRPLEHVLGQIIDVAATTLEERSVALRLLGRGGMPAALITLGVPVELQTPSRRSAEVAEGDGVAARVVRTGELVVIDDYAGDPDAAPDAVAAGYRSAMGAPVLVDGVVVGILGVGSQRPRRYGPEEQTVLRVLAEQVSAALNHHRTAELMRKAYVDAVHKATHDALTGLANRDQITEHLQLSLAPGSGHPQVSVMFVDLDRFKVINDSFGHETGDRLLQEVARRLVACTDLHGVVGRLAGDEFVVICPRLGRTAAARLAEQVLDALAAPATIADRELVVTASVGVTMAHPGDDADLVLRDADVAMYQAKQQGRARVQVFDRRMRTRARHEAEVEQALRHAVARDELRLHYQPIFDITTGALLGLEALLRWERPGEGLVMPGGFIGVAEETGLIVPIGDWVLERACADLADLRRHGVVGPDVHVSLNCAAAQVAQTGMAARTAAVLAATGLPPDALVLELTESALVDHREEVRRALVDLGDLGVRLAIDDFGTGYSSLLYLKRFPVARLKIDRRFTAGVGLGGEDDAIVAAITGLARALRLDVVAEGVEKRSQAVGLAAHGCTAMQGYLLARPAPLAVLDLAGSRFPVVSAAR
jgi:diguanylate cyclase (GGDEF)-like protein